MSAVHWHGGAEGDSNGTGEFEGADDAVLRDGEPEMVRGGAHWWYGGEFRDAGHREDHDDGEGNGHRVLP
jgi:hypothetical protein